MAQYGTLITNIGLAQIANAQITQSKVGLEYIALGDGNGSHYIPSQNQTALVHEVWRGPIAELSIDPTNSNRIIIDAVIPVTAGGFTIREIGIFDDKNQLIAIGQYPEKYKPQLSEGVSEETVVHFVIETNNAEVVKLTIDPTVIIASRNYVDGKVGQVQTALTEHSGQIATTEKLGHIKPDDVTINVDSETGVASVIDPAFPLTDGDRVKVWSNFGDPWKTQEYNLNNLTRQGFYFAFDNYGPSENPQNFPSKQDNNKWLIQVTSLRPEGPMTGQNYIQQLAHAVGAKIMPQYGGLYKRTSDHQGGNWSPWVRVDLGNIDSGFVTCPVSSPFTAPFGADRCRVRRLGHIVTAEAWVQVSGSLHSNTIYLLPNGFRPYSDFTFSIQRQRGSSYIYLNGNCNGSNMLLASEHMSQVVSGDYLVFNVAFAAEKSL